jgi:quercetin dioxygenase-like cupin family protein
MISGMSPKPQRPEPLLDAETAGALAAGIAPLELAAELRVRMRERLLNRIASTAPSGTSTLRAHEGTWATLAPGVTVKVLHQEPGLKVSTFLVRMQPGSRAPVHAHRTEEQCLVLEGEVNVGDHVIRGGDWHVALPGSIHSDFWSKPGCLLLIRAEMPAHPVR